MTTTVYVAPWSPLAKLSERQLPVGVNLDDLIEQVEAVARALADNARDEHKPVPADLALLWQQSLRRSIDQITDAVEVGL